jgi:hypothetical protein
MNKITVPVPQFIVQATPETEFRSYLQVIKNSVGSHMFRNFYVLRDGKVFDALQNGGRSCAFFVSSILVIFKKLESFHNTVYSTIRDMEKSGWVEVQDLKPGDVIVWEAQERESGTYSHIGFHIGEGKAISTSDASGTPIVHHENQNQKWTEIARIYRLPEWHIGIESVAPDLNAGQL